MRVRRWCALVRSAAMCKTKAKCTRALQRRAQQAASNQNAAKRYRELRLSEEASMPQNVCTQEAAGPSAYARRVLADEAAMAITTGEAGVIRAKIAPQRYALRLRAEGSLQRCPYAQRRYSSATTLARATN